MDIKQVTNEELRVYHNEYIRRWRERNKEKVKVYRCNTLKRKKEASNTLNKTSNTTQDKSNTLNKESNTPIKESNTLEIFT